MQTLKTDTVIIKKDSEKRVAFGIGTNEPVGYALFFS